MTSPTFRPAFAAGEIVFDLRDDCAFIVVDMEELGILGRHVADADAHVAVADFTVANQRLSTVGRTICVGMANPMPEKLSEVETRKVLMPITSPRASTSGPPELPGLMAASV